MGSATREKRGRRNKLGHREREAIWGCAESRMLEETVGNVGLRVASAEGMSCSVNRVGGSAPPFPTCRNKALISSQHDYKPGFWTPRNEDRERLYYEVIRSLG